MILSIILSIVFFVLAILHFNWAFGGKLGFSVTIPTQKNGIKVINPKKRDSAIVGFVLTLFALFYCIKSGIIEYYLPDWAFNLSSWTIPILFILRAIGEFKYVGFFKSIKTTDFAKMDTKLFSPLSLVIGILGILIEIIN